MTTAWCCGELSFMTSFSPISGHQAPISTTRLSRHTMCMALEGKVTSKTSVGKIPSLVFVTPSGFSKLERPRCAQLIASALAGGADMVQIRDRCASDSDLDRILEFLMQEFEDPSLFSVNGPYGLKLGRQYPGLGVHLRQADVPHYLTEAKEIPNCGVLSSSAHSVLSVETALEHGGPDYFQVGTMFTTATHPGKEPEGPALLEEIREAFPKVQPLVAIGGINKARARECVQRGGHGIAVITAISEAIDPKSETWELKKTVLDARKAISLGRDNDGP